jgi:peptidoglycan hydrolase CwlO-like protein
MVTEVIKNQTPEERELERKQAELAALEAELIQRELDLATLHAELADFESRYLRTVGVLYAELDEIEAQIAEAQARRRPSDPEAQERAYRARAQAQESSETAKDISIPKPKPTESLKRLFREVAKRIHPDLATNDADRARREKLMAEVNLAYENGDEAKLQSILADWESSPDTVEGEGVGAELIRVIRKIAQIQKRLSEIESEIQQLNTSDLCQLRAKVDEAAKQWRDLLKEMASQVDTQISTARNNLTTVTETNADT